MSDKKPGRQSRPTFTDQEALLFHSQGRPGKLEVIATKPMATQRDLSLAYSPGVAVPVLAIAEDESKAYDYTVKGNFVAVITNGTAILGLGNLGALMSSRLMPPQPLPRNLTQLMNSSGSSVFTPRSIESISAKRLISTGLCTR